MTILSFCLSILGSGSATLGPIRPAPRQADVSARVTNRPGNRLGTVLVLMYHRTGPDEKYMVRSQRHFRADLERLYRLGYRPVTLAEYCSNSMQLPRGASPVVLTFDDADPSQFSIRPDGTIDPGCMVGIWRAFAQKHPDFPVKGTFFVLPNGPWGQKKLAAKKLAMLREWGSEVGSHTVNHLNLSKLTDEQVQSEFGRSYEYVATQGFEPTSMALPFGILPKNRDLVESFRYNGKTHRYWNVVLAGAAPARSPMDPKFDRYRIQRVQAYDGILGITYWLNYNKAHPGSPYVQP